MMIDVTTLRPDVKNRIDWGDRGKRRMNLLKSCLFLNFRFMCMSVLLTCISVHQVCAWTTACRGQKKGIGSLGIAVTGDCEQLLGVLELNLGLLKEQPMLLTAKPFLLLDNPRLTQEDHKLKASFFYVPISRPARATQQDSCLI